MIKKNVEFIVPSNLSSLSDHVVVLGTKTTIRFLGILIYKKTVNTPQNYQFTSGIKDYEIIGRL